jgi:hypothetical protein
VTRRPESDIDVAGFADIPATMRDARVWNGRFLDAFVYLTALAQAPGPDFLKLCGGQVLLDKRQLAASLLERLGALDREGPPPLPESEIQMRRVWARKMLLRVRLDDVEAHYRRHWLLYQLLEDFFALRGEPHRGPKLALAAPTTPLPQDVSPPSNAPSCPMHHSLRSRRLLSTSLVEGRRLDSPRQALDAAPEGRQPESSLTSHRLWTRR